MSSKATHSAQRRTLTIYLRPQDRELISAAAATAPLSLGGFVRASALAAARRKLVPAVPACVVVEVGDDEPPELVPLDGAA